MSGMDDAAASGASGPVTGSPSDTSATLNLHIDVVGDGPPLVLLHGWAMHGGVFAPLLERLRQHHTVHVVDLPGHGLSQHSGIALTLEASVATIAAQVPVAPWCGWSLGGLVALHAAATRPQRLQGLVMLCASPRFVRDAPVDAVDAGAGHASDPWRFGMSAEIFRDFASGLRGDYRGTLDRFIALEAFGSDDARGELRALRGEVFARGEPAAHVLADGLELLETSDLRGALPTLAVPSLWIAGRRDRLVDPRAMRIAADSVQASPSHYVVIEHGGHAPFLTHADEVAACIDAFTATCRRDAGEDASR